MRIMIFCALLSCVSVAVGCSCGDDDDSESSDDSDDDGDDDGGDTADDDTDDDDGDNDTDDDEETRPNIIVVMVDDLDEKALDVLVDGGYMPNLNQRIIEPGFDFRESFVTNPLCCPSRATFLSGEYSHNTMVWTNSPPLGGILRFDDTSTVATWLSDAGYRTGIVGKYLNGYGPKVDPSVVPPGWSDWHVLVDPSTYWVYNYQISHNGTVQDYSDEPQDYQTDVLAGLAEEFVTNAAGADKPPFFLWITPLAPHVEFPETWDDEPPTFADWYELMIRPAPRHEGLMDLDFPDDPSFNEADMSDKPGFLQARPALTETDIANVRRQYNGVLGSMLAVDELIGGVLDAVDAAGAADNTVVIFTSDNGFLYGRHLIPQKNAVYEESIRVPLYMKIPGREPGGSDRMVTNNDLAPTIAELAGAEPTRAVDGRSLLPLIEDPDRPDWRLRTLIEHWSATNTYAEVNTFSAVRTGRGAPEGADMVWAKYRIFTVQTDTEFYHVPDDPYQLDSAHDDPDTLAARETLDEYLEAIKGCVGSECQALEDAATPPEP